jgi:hypothetical protein
MSKIEGICKRVLEETEWVAIATVGDGNAHLVATWGAYISSLGIKENEISVPAGWYVETEKNLEQNDRIEIPTSNLAGRYRSS